MSSELHQSLLLLFRQVLAQQTEVLERINSFNGDLFIDHTTGVFIFSLPALHQFLNDQHSLSFTEFKHTLYQGEFNRSLQVFGGKIAIYRSTGKVEGNLYQLLVMK